LPRYLNPTGLLAELSRVAHSRLPKHSAEWRDGGGCAPWSSVLCRRGYSVCDIPMPGVAFEYIGCEGCVLVFVQSIKGNGRVLQSEAATL
jgi:hypothetical protein